MYAKLLLESDFFHLSSMQHTLLNYCWRIFFKTITKKATT